MVSLAPYYGCYLGRYSEVFMSAAMMNEKAYPSAITSYDLLKAAAIILMIIDHLGAFVFIDESWMRAVGRLSAPIWLFLIGYAKTRHVPVRLLAAAFIMLVANFIVGVPVFTLNILFSLILIRLSLEYIVKVMCGNASRVMIFTLFTGFVFFPTGAIFDYGSVGVTIALFGFFMRHKDQVRNDKFLWGYMLLVYCVYVITQQLLFGFGERDILLMLFGVMLVCVWLYKFSPGQYSKLTAALPRSCVTVIQFCGRRSLEIYVVHFIALQLYAKMVGNIPGEWFVFWLFA